MSWKFLHMPTGLFYGPLKSRRGIKTNLHEVGSIYGTKPSIKERPWFRDCYGKKTTSIEKQWKAVEVKK